MQAKTYFQTLPGGKEITYRESLGEAVFCAIMYGIGSTFFFLAIANLLLVRPLTLLGSLASLAWIAIIVNHVVSTCRRTGSRQHLVTVMGNFIRNRFAEFAVDVSGEPMLCFGYKWRSTRHYFFKLRSNGIRGVDWGQAQWNDPWRDNAWHVALSFVKDSVVFDGTGRHHFGIHIVGPSCSKAKQEAFGNGFIEFLKANQVHLTLPPATLLGQTAEVAERVGPFGVELKIRVGAEEYVARSIQGLPEKGTQVVIDEIRGTSIYVRKAR